MLQLETLMLFGLGFAVAALIALFVARALWLYALRLGRLRSLRQAPATHADLRTEINRLRAENAMTAVRLERKAEALSTRNAELIARTTRDGDRLDLLSAEVERYRTRGPDRALKERTEAELAALEAEARQAIEALEQEIAERDRQIAALRQDLDARDEEIAALRVSADRYAEDVAARDRRLVELEQGFAPSSGTAIRAPDGTPPEPPERPAAPAVPPSERLRMRIEELGELSRQIEAQREALKAEQAALAPAGDDAPAADDSAPVSAADGDPAAPVAVKPSRRTLKPSQRQAGIEALATRLKTIRRDGPSSR